MVNYCLNYVIHLPFRTFWWIFSAEKVSKLVQAIHCYYGRSNQYASKAYFCVSGIIDKWIEIYHVTHLNIFIPHLTFSKIIRLNDVMMHCREKRHPNLVFRKPNLNNLFIFCKLKFIKSYNKANSKVNNTSIQRKD